MNHVPDAALDAIDDFGEALLYGTPEPVAEPLRTDLRLYIRSRSDGETALCRFETDHTQTPPTLRERGSFVTTIVDGVDEQLESWGIVTPSAYAYAETVDGTHYYDATLELP